MIDLFRNIFKLECSPETLKELQTDLERFFEYLTQYAPEDQEYKLNILVNEFVVKFEYNRLLMMLKRFDRYFKYSDAEYDQIANNFILRVITKVLEDSKEMPNDVLQKFKDLDRAVRHYADGVKYEL